MFLKVGICSSESDLKIDVESSVLQFVRGETISKSATVSFIVSAAEFWTQLEPTVVDNIMARIDLLGFINKKSVETVQLGEKYLGLYADDEQWYRVVVDSIDGEDITVRFIDFGNSSVITNNCLREIPDDLTQHPAMALKCTLDGFDASNLQASDMFLKLVPTIPVIVKFVKQVGASICVRLYTVDGEDLNERLGLSCALQGMEQVAVKNTGL